MNTFETNEDNGEERRRQRSATSIDQFVGAQIRLRRAELGVSQEALANELGITFQQVQKYERGKNRVAASRLHQIAVVLQVPLTFFFQGLEEDSSLTDTGSPMTNSLGDAVTLRLLRAFSSIEDRQTRLQAVKVVEAIAGSEGHNIPPVEAHSSGKRETSQAV